MTKEEYQGKLSQLLKEMDELDVEYYDDDQFAFDCDHYFDWPTGTASMMISTKKHYHHRYWVFDKEDEEKAHGEV